MTDPDLIRLQDDGCPHADPNDDHAAEFPALPPAPTADGAAWYDADVVEE